MPWNKLKTRIGLGEIHLCPEGLDECNKELVLSQIDVLPNRTGKRLTSKGLRWASAIGQKYSAQVGAPNDAARGVLQYVGYAKSLNCGFVTSHQNALINLDMQLVHQISGVPIYRIPPFIDWMIAN